MTAGPDGDEFDNSVQEIEGDLKELIKALQKAGSIATKESERNSSNFWACVSGGAIVAFTGLGILFWPPAAGTFLAVEFGGLLVSEGLGIASFAAGGTLSIAGGIINDGKRSDIDKFFLLYQLSDVQGTWMTMMRDSSVLYYK
ncbi:hypothetical protein ABW19_dt0205344 [Dactylella cylindrospora]|nr:hypothetical protein ABW19_dt0205344 [Dactylella cylindrospora]